ncbi:hypothetical protein J715_2659 [Acinetobacter baumannii 1571545]|nr:hypothetical protein J715_2659 [Acinetobacter baumannii 1571545]
MKFCSEAEHFYLIIILGRTSKETSFQKILYLVLFYNRYFY